MLSHEIPPLVLAFLADHIAGLEEFQVLMAVQSGGTRWWDAGGERWGAGTSEA